MWLRSLSTIFILRHALLNPWDKHMTTGRINQADHNKDAGCRGFFMVTPKCAKELSPPARLLPGYIMEMFCSPWMLFPIWLDLKMIMHLQCTSSNLQNVQSRSRRCKLCSISFTASCVANYLHQLYPLY